ncbi:hypothetical protein [Nostoc sp.]
MACSQEEQVAWRNLLNSRGWLIPHPQVAWSFNSALSTLHAIAHF